jgi:hypothetical protein
MNTKLEKEEEAPDATKGLIKEPRRRRKRRRSSDSAPIRFDDALIGDELRDWQAYHHQVGEPISSVRVNKEPELLLLPYSKYKNNHQGL